MSGQILEQLLDAARVIQMTPAIRAFLQKNDPKALEQLERAIGKAEERSRRKPREPMTTTRLNFLRCQVDEQRAWIARCAGGDLAGYVAHYGDPGLDRCYGDGGTAIYKADADELARLEAELRRLA